MIKRQEHLSYEERLRELGPRRDGARGISSMCTNIRREAVKKTKPGSSLVPSDRVRGNGHRLKHKRLHLNIRKRFFTVRVTKHWHRLPRDVAESSSLEIFKSRLDTVLGNQL